MPAQIIDGIALSNSLRVHIADQVLSLKKIGVTPGLAVLLAGADPASRVYVRHKVAACLQTGVHSILENLPADVSESEILARIEAHNLDPNIHGILVQLPLPAHINSRRVIEAISADKDVDGLRIVNAGAWLSGEPGFLPCTPNGCLKILEHIGCQIAGQHAVVIGRSPIVGKPLAMLLLQQNATVTICHSATPNLTQHTLAADVLVSAVGRRHLVTADMVKPGAVVLDVGINRDANGLLCGDVDFAGVRQVASYLTPVPGGVGPMTITMLLTNCLLSAQKASLNHPKTP